MPDPRYTGPYAYNDQYAPWGHGPSTGDEPIPYSWDGVDTPDNTFGPTYASHPWDSLPGKTRPQLWEELVDNYYHDSVYGPFAQYIVQINRTNRVDFAELLMPDSQAVPVPEKQMWFKSLFFNTQEWSLSTQKYAGKVSWHEYDTLISTVIDIPPTARLTLRRNMVEVMDKLMRNAALESYFTATRSAGVYVPTTWGSQPDFGSIAATDIFDLGDIMTVWRQLERPPHNNKFFRGSYPGVAGSMVTVTTPGTILDIQDVAGGIWSGALEHLADDRLLQNVVGEYKGARFIKTRENVLYNCGEWNTADVGDGTAGAQTTITASLALGDGSPDTSDDRVYGRYLVGQHDTSLSLDHAVTVADSSGFAVGNLVTLHRVRTDDYGVTNGVDYREDPITRTIVAIPDGTSIQLDRPVHDDRFETALAGGEFGYVTRGIDVHATVFFADAPALVGGVTRMPRYVNPRPIDDDDSVFRFTWSGYFNYAVWNPHAVFVLFTTATI